MYKRGLCRHTMSARLSVTIVYSVETNNESSIFSPSGCRTILVFPYRTLWQYSDGTPPPNGSVECRWGYRQKSQFSTNIWLNCVLSTVRLPTVIHTAAPDRGKFVTLIASKRRRLLFAGRRRRSVYHKKPQRYARDNRTAFNCTHVW